MTRNKRFVSIVAVLDKDLANSQVKEIVAYLGARYVDYEIVLVDNGLTAQEVQPINALLTEVPCLHLIRLSRRHEREVAVLAGLEVAIGDSVIVMTLGSDPLEVVEKIVELHQKGNDLVYGIATQAPRRGFLSSMGWRFFRWYSNRFLNIAIPDKATQCMGFNRRVVSALVKVGGRRRNLRALLARVGFQTSMLEYEAGEKSFSERGFRDSVNRAFDMVISNSSNPLRIVGWFGIVASLLNALYAMYVLIIYTIRSDVAEGWTTLSLQSSFMFLFVFLSLTIISEYVGRILEEAKGEPVYHVMEDLSSNVGVADMSRRNIAK